MRLRSRPRPWWSVPIAFVAVVTAVVRSEQLTHLIWSGLLKRPAFQLFADLLDRKIPPRKQRSGRKRPRNPRMQTRWPQD